MITHSALSKILEGINPDDYHIRLQAQILSDLYTARYYSRDDYMTDAITRQIEYAGDKLTRMTGGHNE